MFKKLVFLSLFFCHSAFAELPSIIDPVIPATPPGAQVAAGYLSLTNNSDSTLTIDGASSAVAKKVEIHLSKVENDVAKMIKQDSVKVEAGATFEFKHGSYHLMLMGLENALKPGDVVDIILETSNGDILIEMPVKKMGLSKMKKKMDLKMDNSN